MTEKKHWYDKYYKLILLVPTIMLVLGVIYLVQFNAENGDIVRKDVSLTGGTTITVFVNDVTSVQMQEALISQFPDVIIRSISDLRSGAQQGLIIESAATVDALQPAVEEVVGFPLTQENSSIEFSGASLSTGFYKQLRLALLLAFAFMAIAVFIIYRSPAPSLAVIVTAFADIVLTIVTANMMGMVISSAGIAALLMLIGYSIDTDILLTTRVLKKRDESINKRIHGAFKTGLTMSLTGIVGIAVALYITSPLSGTLSQIFTLLLIGLLFDLIFTWGANASILKWYAERKKL